jgi:hypothetical protein
MSEVVVPMAMVCDRVLNLKIKTIAQDQTFGVYMKRYSLIFSGIALFIGLTQAKAAGSEGPGGGAVVKKLPNGKMEITLMNGSQSETHLIRLADWICMRDSNARKSYVLHMLAFGHSPESIAQELAENDKQCQEALEAEKNNR